MQLCALGKETHKNNAMVNIEPSGKNEANEYVKVRSVINLKQHQKLRYRCQRIYGKNTFRVRISNLLISQRTDNYWHPALASWHHTAVNACLYFGVKICNWSRVKNNARQDHATCTPY